MREIFILLEIIFFNISKIKSRCGVIDFIINGAWELNVFLQVYLRKQLIPLLCNLIKKPIEHMANIMNVYRNSPHHKVIMFAWSPNKLSWKTQFAFLLTDLL